MLDFILSAASGGLLGVVGSVGKAAVGSKHIQRAVGVSANGLTHIALRAIEKKS